MDSVLCNGPLLGITAEVLNTEVILCRIVRTYGASG